MQKIRKELEELSQREMEEFSQKFFENFRKAWNNNTEPIAIVHVDSFENEEDFEKAKKVIGYKKVIQVLKENRIFDDSVYIFYNGGDMEYLAYFYDDEIIDFLVDWIEQYAEGRGNDEEERKDELEWIKAIVEDTFKEIFG